MSNPAASGDLVEHFFRRESGRLIARLTRSFGLDRLALAEDVAQDAFYRALELWPVHGVPPNPSAWLLRVARNRAIDLLRREGSFQDAVPELGYRQQLRELEPDRGPDPDAEFEDDQLCLIFACCHPELTLEAGVTLILKTLCGFSVAEIANALLASPDAIEKRLGRARRSLRQLGSLEALRREIAIASRLEAVHQVLYLLFSEGYHGSDDQIVRQELCFEAIRLSLMLSAHPEGAQPQTFALLALMCLQAARLEGRIGEEGLLQLEFQDRSGWDRELMARGFAYLNQASQGETLSAYHLQAAIAAQHCAAPSYAETDWPAILALYDRLCALAPSPVTSLNRAIALGQAQGPEAGLTALASLPDAARLKDYPFYAAARGEFYLRAQRLREAAACYAQALSQARGAGEADFFRRKLAACGAGTP